MALATSGSQVAEGKVPAPPRRRYKTNIQIHDARMPADDLIALARHAANLTDFATVADYWNVLRARSRAADRETRQGPLPSSALRLLKGSTSLACGALTPRRPTSAGATVGL